MIYWAHSDPLGRAVDDPLARWQKLSDHLCQVGKMAKQLAIDTRPNDPNFHRTAEMAGALHDIGKYSPCFQEMIRSGKGKCPHSAHGAAIVHANHADAAFAIAGHHAGIPDIRGGTGSLETRIREIAREAASIRAIARADCPYVDEFLDCPAFDPRPPIPEFDLRTRMAFSCLVDADRLDSASRALTGQPLDPEQMLQALFRHVESLASNMTEGPVSKARNTVLQNCLSSAGLPQQIFSLSVPTGGGKTLAAMAFALRRTALRPDLYRRIIVVIPYLSIIEQNAQVYTDVFGPGVILEHHSGSHHRLQEQTEHFTPVNEESAESRYTNPLFSPAIENWNAPVIVTTSVRFFESLFSNRPSDLRRVHNIARSVVILDEVQTLPRRLLAPLLKMIEELSEKWGCTFIFSTATQPAFQRNENATPKDARWNHGTICEITKDPAALRSALRRVIIEWEIDRPCSWPALAARLAAYPQVLCVVNTREHARVLFRQLCEVSAIGALDGVFHLSTRMCAAHRLDLISRIRERLRTGSTCRVVSTQLVEAGVDIDFPIAFRALGPLDSVVQVAGRADRNGIRTALKGEPAGRLIVFQPEDPAMPPNEYKEASELTGVLARAALQKGESIQPESAAQMEEYWERYYNAADQGQKLEAHRQHASFSTLASEFEMISSRTVDVFVPYGGDAKALIDELRKIGVLTLQIRRRLQRYVVALWPNEFEKARSVLEEVRKDSGVWVASESAYSERDGLRSQIDPEMYVL